MQCQTEAEAYCECFSPKAHNYNPKPLDVSNSSFVYRKQLHRTACFAPQGSTVQREASDKEKKKVFPTFKDNDFVKDNVKIHLALAERDSFLSILKRDIEVQIHCYICMNGASPSAKWYLLKVSSMSLSLNSVPGFFAVRLTSLLPSFMFFTRKLWLYMKIILSPDFPRDASTTPACQCQLMFSYCSAPFQVLCWGM